MKINEVKKLVNKLSKIIAPQVGDYFAEIAVGLVDESAMRHLNKIYRKHDKVTDILSFIHEVKPISGELVLCLPQAERQAKRMGHSLEKEVTILLIHSLLHLAGHDHMKVGERKVMRGLEQKMLKSSFP
ncbi:MAG: rRNA maturation RNase YbeY [Patescibacteria group bacterium]